MEDYEPEYDDKSAEADEKKFADEETEESADVIDGSGDKPAAY